jgi:hypothetical protein
LTVPYPHLTVSSENLADDEREDTSEGEIEPDPDYDLDDDDCCGMTFLFLIEHFITSTCSV